MALQNLSRAFVSSSLPPCRPSPAPSRLLHRRVPVIGALCILGLGAISSLTYNTVCGQSIRQFPFARTKFLNQPSSRGLQSAAMASASTTVPSIVVYVTVPNKEAGKLGKHRFHVKDAWRRVKSPNFKKGNWSQDEYQALFDLVNLDLRMKVNEEKDSKHGMWLHAYTLSQPTFTVLEKKLFDPIRSGLYILHYPEDLMYNQIEIDAHGKCGRKPWKGGYRRMGIGMKLAESIIKEKLAACVNRVPGIESVYWWDGKVQTDSEELLIIKTRESLLSALTEHVKANHEYEVPEIIALPITGGSEKYLEWIKNSTRDS